VISLILYIKTEKLELINLYLDKKKLALNNDKAKIFYRGGML